MRLRALVVVLISVAALGVAAAPALGGGFPTLYATVKGHDHNTVFTPVFAVRPAKVDLETPFGGTLTLKWTTWTSIVAIGHGTALPGVAVSPGQKQPTYPVDVRASRPRGGRFTRLVVTVVVTGHPAMPEHLRLTETDGQFNWMP